MFSCNFLDEEGTAIRCSAFDNAARKFDPFIVEGKVCIHVFVLEKFLQTYLVSHCLVTKATPRQLQFTHIKNKLALRLSVKSLVVEVTDTAERLNVLPRFSFSKIITISSLQEEDRLDIIGIVCHVESVVEFQDSHRVSRVRRTVLVKDPTGSVNVTFWGNTACDPKLDALAAHAYPVVAFQACRVSYYNGRSLSATDAYFINPAVPETQMLSDWWEGAKTNSRYVPMLSRIPHGADPQAYPFRSALEVVDLKVGVSQQHKKIDKENPGFFSFRGRVTHVVLGQTPYYLTPPLTEKDRSVKFKQIYRVRRDAEKYECYQNGKVYDACLSRHRLRIGVTDNTGTIYITLFGSAADVMLGHTATDVRNWHVNGDIRYESLFASIMMTEYTFVIQAYTATWHDQDTLSFVCNRCEPVTQACKFSALQKKIRTLESQVYRQQVREKQFAHCDSKMNNY